MRHDLAQSPAIFEWSESIVIAGGRGKSREIAVSLIGRRFGAVR